MKRRDALTGKKLLLMGSKAFKAQSLPGEIAEKVDEALERGMTFIVGEAPGACRLFQDYLAEKKYGRVLVGHAKSMRYNAGRWKTKKYGENVSEREEGMIEECDCAIVIWADASGVIAENLEKLKRRGTPTFIYECSSRKKTASASWLDPKRVYDPYFYMKEVWRRQKTKKGMARPEE